MRLHPALITLAAAMFAGLAAAADAPVAGELPAVEAEGPARLEEVVVSGDQPGPGLWRVEHGDNTLWILGTINPVPKRMRWKSEEVEALIAESQEVLRPPSVDASTDIGRFRSMLLLPSLLKARNNPDGASLVEVLPADLYARWLPLREKYLGRGRAVEKRRPIFAAAALYRRAIRRSGLDNASPVGDAVEKAAKRHRVPLVQPTLAVKIENPKALIQEFSRGVLDDTACFARTLERLEIELGVMRARANAWAMGDLEALRELPHSDPAAACVDAVLGAEALQRRGFDDLPERLQALWLEAAERALANNRQTFAILPMRELLEPEGHLAALKARGYRVEAPE